MKKHISKFYAVMSLFLVTPLFAGVLPDNMMLDAKLDLFASKANTPETFLADYKAAYARFGIDFTYQVTEELSFRFLPYAQTSYDVNQEPKTKTQARIWQAYFRYKSGASDFNLGRFTFEDETLAPFIYYGDNLVEDLARPTALDGIRYDFTNNHIDFTALLAQEAQIDEDKKAKLAGTKITGKPLDWLNISGFYFFQNKKYTENINKIDSNLHVYGAGIDLFLSESSGLRFYGAKNGGYEKEITPSITTKPSYKGYAFNGEYYSQNSYKTGILNNKLGFYLFSDKEKFVTFPQKLQTGIIYGGMNYKELMPASPQIIYAVFDFNPNKYSFLYGGLSVFVYSSGKENVNSHNYYAKEINLNAGLNFDNWGFKLSGGLFEGEAIFLGGTTTDKQKIKKIQANFFYKFSL